MAEDTLTTHVFTAQQVSNASLSGSSISNSNNSIPNSDTINNPSRLQQAPADHLKHQHQSAIDNNGIISYSTTGQQQQNLNDPNRSNQYHHQPQINQDHSDLAVIFGGLIPYIPQYMKIKRSNSSDGFSTYVCLTLLLANILRINFWFGHHFELPLLIQSFVMILAMLAMMEICVRVRDKSSSYMISAIGIGHSAGSGGSGPASRRRSQMGSVARDFWDWDDLLSYVKFLSLFTLMLGLSTYLFLDNYLYIECLGFVAVFTESMLGTPQLLRNYNEKSTRGMSVEMVVMWLSGDVFKTLYSVQRKTPAQFYVCGSIQVIVDILILGQVFWYQRPMVTYRKLPKST